MSRTIDERIVEMRFDNSNFERNVSQSIDSLDHLKKSLNFDSVDALSNINRAIDKVDFNPISTGLIRVEKSFSSMEVVAASVLNRLTNDLISVAKKLAVYINNPLTLIKSGGLQRALNIEQAKFQLEGLGVAWNDIKDDINYGVKDTAYGLDAAATAASQLVASSVNLGDDMKQALRGISGVAAMTSSSYEEISDIFTTVAGNGKLMTMELRQLSSRGLNVAASLAKALGTTEQNIRDMVTKGQIDFATFAKAMDDAFGTHAKEANKTFTGSLSNMKAALSRLGAEFATPVLNSLRDIFNSLIPVVDNVKTRLGTTIEFFSDLSTVLTNRFTKIFSSGVLEKSFDRVFTVVLKFTEIIFNTLYPIAEAFRNIFPKKTAEEHEKSFQKILSVLDKINSFVSSKTFQLGMTRTFEGFFSALKIGANVIKGFSIILSPLLTLLESFILGIVKLGSKAGYSIKRFGDWLFIGEGQFAQFVSNGRKHVQTFVNIVFSGANIIGKVFYTIKNKFVEFGAVVRAAIEKIKEFFSGFDKIDPSALTGKLDLLKNRLNNVKEALNTVFNYFRYGGGKHAGGGRNFDTGLTQIVEKAKGPLEKLKETFLNFFRQVDFNKLFDTLSVGGLAVVLGNFLDMVGRFSNKLNRFISRLSLQDLALPLEKLTGVVNSTLIALQTKLKADALMSIGKAIAVLAGSLLILSLIDSAALLRSVAAIEYLSRTLMKMMDQVAALSSELTTNNNVFQFGNKFSSTALAMVELASSLMILSVALTILSKIKPSELASGMIALGLSVQIMVKTMQKLATIDVKSLGDSTKAMMKMANALLVLSIALRILSGADPAELAGALASLAIMLGEMALVIDKLSGKEIENVGPQMTKMATSLLILSLALKVVAGIDPERLGYALGTLASSLAVMAIVLGALSNNGNVAKVGAQFLAMSVSLMILAVAIRTVAGVNVENLVAGLRALLVTFTAMAIILGVLSNNNGIAKVGAQFLIMSAAMFIVAKAITAVSKANPDNLAVALGALMIAFAGMAIILGVLANVGPMMLVAAAAMLVGSVAMLAFTAALGGLSVVVMALGASGDVGTKGIVTLAKMLLILAGSLVAVAVLSPAILIASAALASFGAALGIVGLSAKTIAEAIALLVGALAAMAGIAPVATVAAKALAGAIAIVAAGIGQAIPFIAVGLAKGLVVFIQTIGSLGQQIIESIVQIGTAILNGLRELIPQVISFFMELGTALLQAIADNMETWVSAGLQIITGFMNGLARGLPELIDAAQNLVIEFIDGLATSLDNNTDRMIEAVDHLMDSVVKAFKKWVAHFIVVGVNIIEGIKEGLLKGVETVKKAAATCVSKIKSFFTGKDALDINSPSKWGEWVGQMIDDGVANGIDSSAGNIKSATDRTIESGVKSPWRKAVDWVRNQVNTINSLSNEKTSAKVSQTDAYIKGLQMGAGSLKKTTEQTQEYTEATDKATKSTGGLSKSLAGGGSAADTTADSMDNLTGSTIDLNSALQTTNGSVTDLSSSLDKQPSKWEKIEAKLEKIKKKAEEANSMINELTQSFFNLMTSTEDKTGQRDYDKKMEELNEQEAELIKQREEIYAKRASSRYSVDYSSDLENINKQLDEIQEKRNEYKKEYEELSMTPEELLGNWERNQNMAAQYEQMIEQIRAKGANKKLTAWLAQQLSQGNYDIIKTFAAMTEEELQRANELYKGAISESTEFATDIVKQFDKAGVNAAKTFIKKLNKYKEKAKKAGYKLGIAALSGVKLAWGINSPSKKAIWLVDMIGAGLTKEVKYITPKVASVMGAMGATAVEAMTDSTDGIEDSYNGLLDGLAQNLIDQDLNPVITPILDLSQLEQGLAYTNSLFNGSYIPVYGQMYGQPVNDSQNESKISETSMDELADKVVNAINSRLQPEEVTMKVNVNRSGLFDFVREENNYRTTRTGYNQLARVAQAT